MITLLFNKATWTEILAEVEKYEMENNCELNGSFKSTYLATAVNYFLRFCPYIIAQRTHRSKDSANMMDVVCLGIYLYCYTALQSSAHDMQGGSKKSWPQIKNLFLRFNNLFPLLAKSWLQFNWIQSKAWICTTWPRFILIKIRGLFTEYLNNTLDQWSSTF